MLCLDCTREVNCLFAEQAGNVPEVYRCAKCILPYWVALDAKEYIKEKYVCSKLV